MLAAGCGSQHQESLGGSAVTPPSAVTPLSAGDATPAAVPPNPTATGAPVTASRASDPLDPGAAQRAAERLATTTPSRLPTTPAAAEVLLAAMPGTVAGAARTRSGPKDVTWANGSAVTAAPLAEAAAPGQSMRQFFDAFAASGQFTVARRSGPSDRLLWFVGTGNQTGGSAVAALADANGQWLYGIEAADGQALQQLVDAVVARTS